ncbi:hypothetical protein BRARA_G03467 [Brassica rapa]|uniref:Uncharacterized protein n=1 Tax=Brassica campestris TaxID=3711 RepID=A0A397YW44_BRACM|nr:hypothetical protein BRARA_G03467 [Brassica rapa]
MDFHGMNRKNLQILCKKHGIPANLKNIEMANRLSSLIIQKEEEEENLVASRKAKKVRFSPETDNQVFEFTRSVKKSVRTRKAPQAGGGIELRRSKRIGSIGSVQEEGLLPGDRDIQDERRSTRLAARIEKACVEGGTSKAVALLPAAKRSKRSGSCGSSTQEEGEDNDLNAPERVEDRDVQGGRRSRRLAAKTEKSSEEGGMSKSVTLLPAAKRSKGLVDVANKEDERETGEPNRKGGGSEVEMVRRRSMRFVNEQTSAQDQRRSVRLKASVEKTLVGQAKNDSVKASRVVKGNLVDKKTDENLVKSKRVTRNMKRGRSGEPEVDSGAASNQSNLTLKKTLNEFAHFEQEEACGADVKAGGSSKNQKCIEDKPQGIIIIEDSPSSSKTKAAESVEKVFDPTLDKSADSSQRSNSREINCESVEGDCEEKLERETVSMPVMEEDKEEVSPRSLSSPKDKLHVPTGHIIVQDIASTFIAEESTKTKDKTLIYSPESELKENSCIAKLANVEESLENSTERWKEIHSGKDDEKGSLENDVQAENLHGNVSECNTESSSAEEEMEISKIGGLSVAHCVNLIPEKFVGEYSQLEPEEAERPNVEARSSCQKVKKIVAQEFVKDKPQEMAEDSPSTSETKATEPTVISENVLDSTRTVSGETSAVRNSHELNSEVLEEGREEKHEQAKTKKDKGETSSLSEFLTERSEVKTCLDNRITSCSLSVEATLSPASVQLAMSNPEADLGVPTGNEEETLILTPTSELKEDNAVAKISKVEAILGNSAECCKEDEKGSLEKDVQAENLHVNFSECNTAKSSSEEVEISKDGSMSVNLTPEKLLDTYTQLVPEEAGGPNVEIRSSSKKMKIVSSECPRENPQGMAEESPSTFVTKTAETLMMSENFSVDISPVGNTQELNHELRDEEREEKQELDIVLVAETEKEKKKASSPSELFVETTPPPPSLVQIAVSNPESELSVPTGHILGKDIVSAVIAEEAIKTEEVSKSVQSFVAKFAETDVLENSAECSSKSLSSKDDGRGSLEKEKQSAKLHGNFSEYNSENISAEEQADICKVGRISPGHCVHRETLDEVEDESLMKSVQTISSARGCKPNALELSGSFSTDFASLSHKKENVSDCLEEEEMKALSQPIPIQKAASNVLERSSLFTTPERNLMLMEQQSESGKICEADIVTQHNDEAVESHAVVFTTPEKVLLLGDSWLDDVGKEGEHTARDFPDESDVLNTSANEAFNEGERIVVELHDESNIAASPLRHSRVGNFKEERTERNEEKRTVELHFESGTFTGPDKHDGAENSEGNKAMELYEESVDFTGLEERHELFRDSGKDKAREDELKMDAQFYEEAGLSTEMHKDLPLADPELGEAGWLGINNDDKSGSLEGKLLYGDSEQKKAEKAPAEFHDESAVPSIPERHPFPEESELEEAAKSEENNALESQADCDNFTDAIVNAKSHDMSDVLTAPESHSIMGAFEPDGEENKDVELLGESNISTNEESGQDGKIKYNTAATCEESSFFISPERRHHLGNTGPHTAGKQERKEVEFKDESAFFTRLETRLLLGESTQDRLDNGKSGSAKYQSHRDSSRKMILKDDSVARECQVAAPDFRENTIADFSGSIASKVSYSHEFSAGEVSAGAEFMPKASQVENVAGLDATQGTSKQSRGNSPNVDTCHSMEADTIMDAGRNVSFSSYVLSLPAEGNSETIGEISNHIEVAGTCSLVSEESGPSTDIQNQIHDAVEELAVTDEIVDAKLIKNSQSDSKTISLPAEGDSKSIGENSSQLEATGTCSMVSEKSIPSMDIQNHINDALEEELAVTDNSKADELIEAKVTKNVDSSDGSGKTCVLTGTEDEHLCYNSEVADPVDTAFEKDISLTPDESTLQKNKNQEEISADDEMLKREDTPSPAETFNESSENIGESSEKQVRREQVLFYRTQAKPKTHDMKENAPNSKIVDNLNVTAPRTSKRQPLQDLRKN